MAYPMLAWINHVDRQGVTFAASSEISSLPATFLADSIVKKVWRTSGATAATLDIDFGAEFTGRAFFAAQPSDLDSRGDPVDAVLAATDTLRWRLGTAVGLGDVYDSTALACGMRNGYGLSVHLAPADKTARYLRLDVNAPSLAATGYFQLGRVGFMPVWQCVRAHSFGAGAARRPLTKVVEGERSGAEYVDLRGSRRVVDFALEWMSAADMAQARALDDAAQNHGQVLWIPDPASADIGLEAIYGRIEEATPILRPDATRWSKAYRIRQSR